jgi:hypothetical protein
MVSQFPNSKTKDQPLMSMYDLFKTDPSKEANGVVVGFGKFRVTTRRAGGANKKYQKVMEELVAPYRRIIQLGSMQEGKMRELLAEGYARAIVTNWEYEVITDSADGLSEPTVEWKQGLELPDGKIGEVTPENVKAVLMFLPDIFNVLKEVSETIQNYRTEDDEAAKGN